MKKVVMFFCGSLFPVNMGNKRLITEMARHLNSLQNVELTLVCLDVRDEKYEDCYRELCHEIKWIRPPRRWSFWDLLNKIVSRLGLDVLKVFFTALSVRGEFVRCCQGADWIILNYTAWFPLLPRGLRRAKCIVNTLDLLCYRRASFGGVDSAFKRMMVWINRVAEMHVLSSYAKVCVLADYEKELLLKNGVDGEKILHIGFPMVIEDVIPSDRNREKKFDFVFLGGGMAPKAETAVNMFFEKVATLFPERKLSFVMTQRDSWNWEKVIPPKNVELIRMGFVDSIPMLLSQVKIGVSTPPMGSGIKTKTVEMIMNGLPVVVSNHGIEGIPTCSDAVLNIDEADVDTVRRTVSFWLDNPDASAEIGTKQGEELRKVFSPHNCLGSLVACLLKS